MRRSVIIVHEWYHGSCNVRDYMGFALYRVVVDVMEDPLLDICFRERFQ